MFIYTVYIQYYYYYNLINLLIYFIYVFNNYSYFFFKVWDVSSQKARRPTGKVPGLHVCETFHLRRLKRLSRAEEVTFCGLAVCFYFCKHYFSIASVTSDELFCLMIWLSLFPNSRSFSACCQHSTQISPQLTSFPRLAMIHATGVLHISHGSARQAQIKGKPLTSL